MVIFNSKLLNYQMVSLQQMDKNIQTLHWVRPPTTKSQLVAPCDSCVVLQLISFVQWGPITLQLTLTLNFGSRGLHFMKQLWISCPSKGQQISCPLGLNLQRGTLGLNGDKNASGRVIYVAFAFMYRHTVIHMIEHDINNINLCLHAHALFISMHFPCACFLFFQDVGEVRLWNRSCLRSWWANSCKTKHMSQAENMHCIFARTLTTYTYIIILVYHISLS